MESQPAAEVGSWRKLVELGSGRTGSVALCIEPTSSAQAKTCADQNGVLHAVKRMDRQSTTNSVAVRRILQEKKALQALQGQRGIVELRFTAKDNDNLYFVLEPLLGGPLHRHIRGGPSGRLEVTAVNFYASQVTSAIGYMHTRGFVHRDIKASNIVLGADGHAKLVDLGCSKQLKTIRGEASGNVGDVCLGGCEKTFTYCGTPHCMAPEMISREGHGFAVDWWALGILVHEMLNGAPPFGYEGGELLERIAAGLPGEDARDAKTDADDSVEPRFLPIVRRLLHTDPHQRLGSTSDADEVMSHEWFRAVDWAKTAKLESEPPPFRKDLGELEYLDEKTRASATNVDPDGLFADF